MTGESLSARISDTDRLAAERRLRDACAEGRLSVDELGERLQLAFAARTAADLAPLLDDLPAVRRPRRKYAHYMSRVVAFLVDEAIVAAGSVAVIVALPHGGIDVGFLVGAGVANLLNLAYFTAFLGGRRGQTPGCRLAGIAVRDAESGGRITYVQSFGRTLAMTVALAGFLPFAGFSDFLWPLWDSERQTLHDKAAGTVVLEVER